MDESELWPSTVRQLLDEMLPTILQRYPYINDDGIELLDLRIEKL